MHRFSRLSRLSGSYVQADEDPQKNADCIMKMMGSCVSNIETESTDRQEKHLLMIPNKKWRKYLSSESEFKYILKKFSRQKYIFISCSKNCPKCHGCSPGCGKKFEYDKIKSDISPISPDNKYWEILWKKSEDNQHKLVYLSI